MRFLGVAAAAAFIVAGSAHAAVLVDRGLPTDNLNHAAGSDRSNVSWGFQSGYSSGDTFSLSSKSSIDSLTTWFTTSLNDGYSDLGDRFTDISLYLGAVGPSGTPVGQAASSAISGDTATGPGVTISKVTYDNGEDYQNTSGTYSQLWEVTFTGLGVFSPGDYLFSVFATPAAGVSGESAYTFNHASNAALGGVPADGADGLYAWFSGSPGDASLFYGGSYNSDGNGWDKVSDINIVVEGAVVPLPASGLLLVAGAGCLVALRRRRTG